jgi:segregation and condensation protein B
MSTEQSNHQDLSESESVSELDANSKTNQESTEPLDTESQSKPQRLDDGKLKNILEAALMAVSKPMSIEQLMKLFVVEERPSASRVKSLLKQLQDESEGRGIELKDVASGYRYQSRQDYSIWISRLYEERPAKYSRAYLETLALIAYRQPVTRAEIEDVRGVGVSSSIIKTMVEREWIRVVGHRDVPGRPSLYATTKQFLDYFNMKSLEELPSLAEIKDLEDLNPELELPEPGAIDESEVTESSESSEGLTETNVETETDLDIDREVGADDIEPSSETETLSVSDTENNLDLDQHDADDEQTQN